MKNILKMDKNLEINMPFGKYLANDGADKIGQYWIKLEKTIDHCYNENYHLVSFLKVC